MAGSTEVPPKYNSKNNSNLNEYSDSAESLFDNSNDNKQSDKKNKTIIIMVIIMGSNK